MRRSLLCILSIILPYLVCGQLCPLSNQYIFNALAINPAYSGSRETLSTSILYRNQWVGFEGSPETMTFSLHAPLRNDRIGIGLLLINDKIGVTNETGFIGNYAFRIDFGSGKLAFGLGAGLILINTAWTDLVAVDRDDELLMDNSTTFVLPDFSVGTYFNTNKYFIGFSLPLFLNHRFNPMTNKFKLHNDFSEYNYLINGGYIFEVKPDVKVLPSLLIRYNPGNSPQLDLNSHMIFKDKLWIGMSYRSKNTMVGMFQYQINNQFRVAYSYDFELGKLGRYNNGSHEIMLRYEFSYTIDVFSPRYF
ncbi:MAG: type IX secretion system membrane protein PorP/SprF [Bacteroidales bacterium]|nr:type IX secretion system membrane protein PorP/SprF [Bacteroidales bacterium]